MAKRRRKNERPARTIVLEDPVEAYFEACRRAKRAKDVFFAIIENAKGYGVPEQRARLIRCFVITTDVYRNLGEAKGRLRAASDDPKAVYQDWKPGKADLERADA